MNYNTELRIEEQAAFALRSLYSKYGYSKYKMSKFEEYDLYVKNKDFLISDSVITFTDTNGKLMALKPDVTLSIIKNTKDTGEVSRVFYNENVYRISSGTSSYKEIMQVGLECIGNIDLYNIAEVLTLAIKSLKAISNDCVLDISHMGVVSAFLDKLNIPADCKSRVTEFMSNKNTHEAEALLRSQGVNQDKISALKKMMGLYGNPKSVIQKLKEIIGESDALLELESLTELLSSENDIINIDFSVINDMKYYNGIVFKGFVKSVPSSVLSGGQYDNLMHRMGKKSGAIGFAVYLDLLEGLSNASNEFDTDILLVYDEQASPESVLDFINKMADKGACVTALKTEKSGLRYKELYKIVNGEAVRLENNA